MKADVDMARDDAPPTGSATRTLLLCLLIPTIACERQVPTLVATVQDSADIEIVINPHTSNTTPRFAQLDSAPLVIGALDGEDAYTFSSIKDLRGLPGGRVLVAEASAREIRIFDSAGTHLTSLGGPGEGPGEFSNLTGVAGISGDTVWAWDVRNQRLSSFLLTGEYLDAITWQGPPPDHISALHRLGDGSFVAMSRWRPGNPSVDSYDLMVVRDTFVLRHLGSDLTDLDTISVTAGPESLRENLIQPGSGNLGFSVRTREMAFPFARNAYYAVGRESIVLGESDSFEWLTIAPGGQLRRISRLPEFDRPIDGAEKNEVQSWLEGLENHTTTSSDHSRFP